MHPHCVTSEIDEVWLRCLVRKLRDYARYWYDCCKGPGASKPNRKNVYGRQNCGVCGSVICLIRDGVLQRITYLCSKCQIFPAQHRHQESLKNQSGEKFFAPGRSTICLEVRKPDEEQKDDICVKASWTCLYCTLDNVPDLMTCEICNTVRHAASVPRAVESSTSCAYSESNMSVVRTPFHSADKSDGSQGDTVPSACPDGTRASLGKFINDENINNNVRPQPKVDAAVSAVGDGDGTGHSFLLPMMCKCFKQGGLNRVRKSGPTNSRLFWSCSGRKCDFFSWADGTFPKCQHGAPCTVRRVLKPGPTNGQYFFSCSQETKCNYFLWSNKHVPLRPVQVPYPDVTHNNGKRHLGAQSESNTGKKFKHITIPL
jgi:GRF zinc finger